MNSVGKVTKVRAGATATNRGFSLVELSIVLVVIGLLIGSAAVPFSSAIKQTRIKRTAEQLATIREALHGYLISTGSLPCPISISSATTAVSTSAASKATTCSVQHGVVPGQALGVVGEHAANGALLDAWGREYLYSVSMADHDSLGQVNEPDWLTNGEASAVGASNLSADLLLCRTAASGPCPKKDLIANQIVWVVHSQGESIGTQGLEAENRDNDNVFVVSGYSSNEAQPFNDQIIWASRSELVYWLLKANWLP